jgi:hypothetical protein
VKIDIGYWLGEAEQVLVGAWQWRKARSLQDMLDIRTEELIDERGGEDERPAGDPDELFYLQMSTEIALSRAGLLLGHTTLGGRFYNSGREVRATITGLAPAEVVGWLELVTAGTRYTVLAHRPYKPGQPVEDRATRARDTGVASTRDIFTGDEEFPTGVRQPAHEVFMMYPVRRSVGQELRDCWQVTVYDTQWGENDLFPFLLGEAHSRTESVQA